MLMITKVMPLATRVPFLRPACTRAHRVSCAAFDLKTMSRAEVRDGFVQMETIEQEALGTNAAVASTIRSMFTDKTFTDYVDMISRIQMDKSLLDVTIDIGRQITLHFRDDQRPEILPSEVVTEDRLEELMSHFSTHEAVVQSTGRCGVEGTLHRVSVLEDFRGNVSGLTIRIGRSADMFDNLPGDVMSFLAKGRSLLVFGRPGCGKTTLLRNVSEFCSDHLSKRTIVVETSGELGGYGKVHNHSIGFTARRMCIPHGSTQYDSAMKVIRNHSPEVLIFDEMVSAKDAQLAQTAMYRGVNLVTTVHGSSLRDIVLNPAFTCLIGGVQHAAISDSNAKSSGTKFVSERKTAPVFDGAYDLENGVLYDNLEKEIDSILKM